MDDEMADGRVTTREFYDKLTEVEVRLLKRLDRMGVDIRDLQLSKAVLEGKADQKSVYFAYAISIASLVVASVSLLLG